MSTAYSLRGTAAQEGCQVSHPAPRTGVGVKEESMSPGHLRLKQKTLFERMVQETWLTADRKLENLHDCRSSRVLKNFALLV